MTEIAAPHALFARLTAHSFRPIATTAFVVVVPPDQADQVRSGLSSDSAISISTSADERCTSLEADDRVGSLHLAHYLIRQRDSS